MELVQSWWVSDEATGSDHNLIRATLRTPPPVTKMVRKIRKSALPEFKDALSEVLASNPLDSITTYAELEMEGNFLLTAITEASDALFPLRETVTHSSLHYWMNQHLRNQRKGLTKDRKTANRNKQPIYTPEYKEKQKKQLGGWHLL